MSKVILSAKRLEALRKWPHLSEFWPFISAAVLTVNNCPHEIPLLYEYVRETADVNKHVAITRSMQEGIFKTAGLCGLPKVINSLTCLKDATPKELRATEPCRTIEHDYDTDGNAMFQKVYGKITNRVMGNMRNAYPDLPFYAIHCLYGPLFSPTGNGLGSKETCLVIVAALVPQDVIPQLKGHLKGALNCGATQEEVDATCALSKEITSWCVEERIGDTLE